MGIVSDLWSTVKKISFFFYAFVTIVILAYTFFTYPFIFIFLVFFINSIKPWFYSALMENNYLIRKKSQFSDLSEALFLSEKHSKCIETSIAAIKEEPDNPKGYLFLGLSLSVFDNREKNKEYKLEILKNLLIARRLSHNFSDPSLMPYEMLSDYAMGKTCYDLEAFDDAKTYLNYAIANDALNSKYKVDSEEMLRIISQKEKKNHLNSKQRHVDQI